MFLKKTYCHDGLQVMDWRSSIKILVELLVYVLFMFGVHESWIRLLNFDWKGLIEQAKQKLVMISQRYNIEIWNYKKLGGCLLMVDFYDCVGQDSLLNPVPYEVLLESTSIAFYQLIQVNDASIKPHYEELMSRSDANSRWPELKWVHIV